MCFILQFSLSCLHPPERHTIITYNLKKETYITVNFLFRAQEQSIRGGNDYLWPYEAYKKNMKQNSQSQPKEDKNGNVELSSDAQTALWFDVFALFVALSCVLYVAFVKNKL